MRICTSVFLLAFVFSASAETAPDFAQEIRPILSNACFKCHGPDPDERKGGKEGSGGLRLDTEEGARADLGGGAFSVVPGKPEQSELIARIMSDDRDEVMPPPKSGKKLSPREIELLKGWIRAGAQFAKHWAYAPLAPAPSFPNAEAPSIDAFVRARHAREGLQPQPEADRYTLIRRLALDLTGLPPTPDEADAFVSDPSDGAYVALVDRLLASPAFGEHWGRLWLDLARYADSAGYADDPPRTIWGYRDYVIRAFNANTHFDQFTIEQIAGDLLPNPTEDQLIATAFHRNTMTNNEGGTIDEEFRNVAIVDRVNTTMAVWMGTSMACAQCHSHKYDPISQEEYFRVFAFFNQSEDADRRDESPLVSFYGEPQKAERDAWERELSALEEKLKMASPELSARAAVWARGLPAQIVWQPLKPDAQKAQSGAAIELRDDASLRVKSTAKTDTYTLEFPLTDSKLTALRIEALPDDALPAKGPGNNAGNFVVTRVRAALLPAGAPAGPRARFVRIELPGKAKLLQIAEVQVFSGGENVALRGEARQISTYDDAVAARAIDGRTDGEYAKGSVAHTAEGDDPWWEVDLKSEQSIERVVIWNRAELGERLQGFRLVALDAQRQPVWIRADNEAPKSSANLDLSGGREIAFTDAIADFTQPDFNEDAVIAETRAKRPRKTGPQNGWAIGGAIGQPHTLALIADRTLEVGPGAKLRVTIEQHSAFAQHTLGRFRLSTTAEPRVAEVLRVPAEVLAEFNNERHPALGTFYLREVAPEFQTERDRIAALHKQLDEMPKSTVPIMRDLPPKQRRKTNVHLRGNYLSLGGEVTEGVPSAFHPLPPDAPLNRLTFARWLVDEHNALTARVIANRFWEAIFGVGLVRTSEEFGAQGELPSHPEMLDWLAGELVRGKWDMKRFIKLLVTSATYRQSSRVTPELAERDPENRLLARGPRVRLSAEMVRDQALLVSGLLSRKMYGPSVRPPRPALGLSAAFGGGLDWQTSAGEDRHRRALYTEWRRTSPYPSMSTFDAPNREVCTLRRNRSNTPLQALVTLNDPVYIEAAQGLARRIAPPGTSAADRARLAFRHCLTRPPSESEVRKLVALHDETLALFKDDSARATAMAANPIGPVPEGADVAELAAWTAVSNVLLNLDEALMKR